MESIGINTILNCTCDDSHSLKNDEDIQYMQIPVKNLAEQDISAYFNNATTVIGTDLALPLSFVLSLRVVSLALSPPPLSFSPTGV